MSKFSRAIRVSSCVLLAAGLAACGGSSGGVVTVDSESSGSQDETTVSDETTGTDGTAVIAGPEPAPAPIPAPEPEPAPAPQPEPVPAPAPAPAPAPEPEPAPIPAPVPEPTPEPAPAPVPEPEPAPAPTPAPPTLSALDGDWTTGCFLFDGEGNTQSSLLTLSINGTSSVYTAYSYSDFNCSVPAISDTGAVILNGNEDILEFPDETVETSLGEASFINFTTVSSIVDSMPVPDEFVAGSRLYSIYTITDDGQLFFGNGASNNPDTRPLTLDVFFFYVRM